MTLTEQDVERVARAYCRLGDQDPDDMVNHSATADANGYVPMVLMSSPRWMLVANRVRDEDRMRRALTVLDYTSHP